MGYDLDSLMQEFSVSKDYETLHWSGSFDEYLGMVAENPEVLRNAFQRTYDMILSYGVETVEQFGRKHKRYGFFSDPMGGGRDAIFGMIPELEQIVAFFEAAARGMGAEKRILLLRGPVGSAKSTLVRLLKKGLEDYSRKDEGVMFTFDWVNIDGEPGDVPSPMNDDPFLLIPSENGIRQAFADRLFEGRDLRWPIRLEKDLNPSCRFYFDRLMQKYEGRWQEVVRNHVRVRRMIISEKGRVGIGTFQPKDEKNQDSTELTGDVNYRKIAQYGSDSDPRAFSFDGEFCVANRGLIEFVEILKLDTAFLYDLLGATQEHKIKPKKFAQTDIDEVIVSHTNEPEYLKLLNNDMMEAFRDRTVKIDAPYVTCLNDEIQIYEKDFGEGRMGKKLAPHAIEVAAMWAVLTRLEEPDNHQLSLLQKLKLYNGKTLPGFTEDNVREIRDTTRREGLDGISPRYIQDKLSQAIVKYPNATSINPFMVLKELEAGLKHHGLIKRDEDRKRYKDLLSVVKGEYEEIIKNEVQKAISADEDAIARMFSNYIDNVKAYVQKEKVKDPYTGRAVEPNHRLMRSIEEKIEIPETRADDFRREIMNYVGAMAIEDKKFEYHSNERLQRALELKLFEDQKDSIKLNTLMATVVDQDTQEKIDIVKARLIKYYGYDDQSATDVLNYVASIYARGDTKE